MYFLNTFFAVALLATTCLAASISPRKLDIIPCHEAGLGVPCMKKEVRKIVSIEEGTLSVPIVHQSEDVNFAVNRSSSGFSRVTGVGVSVQRGVSATLRYNISVTAVTSERISSFNESFVDRLNETEIEIYDRLVRTYNNGLSIPWLRLLGINFGTRSDRETQEFASMFISRYNELSTLAEEILESTEEARVSVIGDLVATGQSMVPVEGFVFIRTSRVTFNDGTSRLVVTSDPGETEAATLDGDVLPSSDKNLFTGNPDDVPDNLFG